MSDPAVHRLRVESRRVMAVLALAGPDRHHHTRPVRKVARAALEALSALRDAHVQIGSAKELAEKYPDARPFVRYLNRRERRLRKAAAADLRDIHVHRAGRACASLARAADDQASASAAWAERSAGPAIAAAWDEVEERLKVIDAADLRTIHRLRVALKRVRYMFEAGDGVGGLDPRIEALRAADLVAAVRRMGRLHDVETLVERADAFAGKRTGNADAVASLRDLLVRRRTRLLRQVMADLPLLRRGVQTDARRPPAASARQTPQRRGRQKPHEGSRRS